MAMFVHIAPESGLARIRRNGTSRSRRAAVTSSRGVFAVPVTRNFYVSNAWVRELKRRSGGSLFGMYFRIPDDDSVWVAPKGRFVSISCLLTPGLKLFTLSETK
jgi:hypothetical protein